MAEGRQTARPRLIGRYDEGRPGPLVVVLGAVHGNEPAGVAAARRVLAALARERDTVPDFVFRGRLAAFVGNVAAFAQSRRFLRHDLNRRLDPAHVDALAAVAKIRDAPLVAEDREATELTAAVRAEVAAYGPKRVIVVDLHTTTAPGGAFSIVHDEPIARRLARACHAPAVLGMLTGGLAGTTLHAFVAERLGVPAAGLVFESGQHAEPAAVDRAVSALTLLLEEAGCVDARHVAPLHARRLRAEYAHLPAEVALAYVHRIAPRDRFVMRPGYVNFMEVEEGEALGDDIGGQVLCPVRGRVLMPLYQAQGGEGFFVVREV